MKITATSGPKRLKPQAGDRKIIKGVEHVRCMVMAFHQGRWMLDHTGGRQRYKWVAEEDPNRRGWRYFPGGHDTQEVT